ncbi:hypothetical protein AU467_22460 [Mesorhizobium loti]|uniref:Uncharacterized protein n=1 Tax=Rhizobium loti TaxID=381 RepID=A0A101KSX1_RHILI|nr:hypothetical protein AU467_22460 [Mesorhizobium loti]
MIASAIVAPKSKPYPMLADDILAAPYQSTLHREIFECAKLSVANAVRFILDRDVVVAAHLVADAMPSSIVAGLPLCRLPYPTTWFEYAGLDRPARTAPGTIVPGRVGLLCEMDSSALDTFTVSVFLAHRSARDAVELSPVALSFDMSASGRMRPHVESQKQKRGASIGGLQKELKWSAQLPHQKIATNQREFEAALELSNRVLFEKSRYFAPLENAVVANAGKSAFESLMRMGQSNSEAEAGPLLGILMLLNTRNGTTRQFADLVKLNAARRKRGVEPLLEHWTVTLRLSAGRARALARWDVPGHEMRAHLVRGHFKIRKSGIYWWSPHVRGHVELGMTHKDYRIRR